MRKSETKKSAGNKSSTQSTKLRKQTTAASTPKLAPAMPSDWIGSMKDTIQILGDIISPATDEDEWEVLRD